MRLWHSSEHAEVFKQYGASLRAARKKNNMSYEDVGSLVGVRPRTVRVYENGRTRPSKETALKLYEVLGVAPVFVNMNNEKSRYLAAYHQRGKIQTLLEKKMDKGLQPCEQIEACRLRMKMTQVEFAAWLGIPYRSYISIARMGRNVARRKEHAKAIKDKLGIVLRTGAYLREHKKKPRVAWRGASLGQRVRMIRRFRGLTLAQLADRSGVCKTHLSFLENGKMPLTEAQHSFIFQALGVSSEEMRSRAEPFDLS